VKLKVTPTSRLSLQALSLRLAVALGIFLKFKELLDQAQADEQISLNLVKVLSDAAELSDAETLLFGKVLTDPTLTADLQEFVVGKTLFDGSLSAESIAKLLSKPITDATQAAEVISLVAEFRRSFTEIVGATDDLDGTSVADDDQTIKFGKILQQSAHSAEVLIFEMAKVLSHGAESSESGSGRMQDYCDFDYFAEDYVGVSFTF
jgi:hypothetical protein